MSKNIFRTKSINQFLSETKQDGGMNRVLGTFGLTMLGIGCIVGTGIFVLTGIAAANYSGPALVISFIIAALACGCAALCYSEFAAMIPVAGSAYTYGYVALGEFWAWVIGWDLILEYTLALSAVSIGWDQSGIGSAERIHYGAGRRGPHQSAGYGHHLDHHLDQHEGHHPELPGQ